MPRLQVLNGKRQGTIFEVRPGTEVVIGHRASATIAIDDPWVSWDHARLFFNGDPNSCCIEDLGSTNGTYVNCVRVKREQLRHQDIIFLGKTHVIFLAPADEGPSDPFATDPKVASNAPNGGYTARTESSPTAEGTPPLKVPSSAQAGIPVGSSSFGVFESGSSVPGIPGLPTEKNPFASTGSPNAPAPLWTGSGSSRGKDPFSDSSVDPFSSGPDYNDMMVEPPTVGGLGQPVSPFAGNPGTTFPAGNPALDDDSFNPFEVPDAAPGDPFARQDPFSQASPQDPFGGFPPDPSSAGLELPLPNKKPSNPFAETRGDEQLFPAVAAGAAKPQRRGISLSDLQDEGDPQLPGPTSQDIVNLIEDSRRGKMLTAASDPNYPGLDRSTDELEAATPSEMRTRQIDTDRVNRLLVEHEHQQRGAPPPPPAAPAPPPPAPRATHAAPTAPPAPPPPATALASSTEDAGNQAFEKARLQDEVRRLRMALQSAQQQHPEAVRAAAQALRDQELGRLALRVAELERELAQVRMLKERAEQELNDVTDDMIDKEDTLDSLRAEVERLRGGSGSSAVPFGAGGLEDDLSSLEF